MSKLKTQVKDEALNSKVQTLGFAKLRIYKNYSSQAVTMLKDEKIKEECYNYIFGKSDENPLQELRDEENDSLASQQERYDDMLLLALANSE